MVKKNSETSCFLENPAKREHSLSICLSKKHPDGNKIFWMDLLQLKARIKITIKDTIPLTKLRITWSVEKILIDIGMFDIILLQI